MQQLVQEALEEWNRRGSTSPVRLEFKGEGSEQDFDAAVLSIELFLPRGSALRASLSAVVHTELQLRGGDKMNVKVRAPRETAGRVWHAVCDAIFQTIRSFLDGMGIVYMNSLDAESRAALASAVRNSARQAVLETAPRFLAPSLKDEERIKVEVPQLLVGDEPFTEPFSFVVADRGPLEQIRIASMAP